MEKTRPSPFLMAALMAAMLQACVASEPQAATQPESTGKSLPARPGKYEGIWEAEFCDKNRPDVECGSLKLYIVQDGDRLCGRHSAATIGLGQVDEGQPRSIVGVVAGEMAIMTLASGRNDGIYLAGLHLNGQHAKWDILESVREPSTGGGIVVSPSALLGKGVDESTLEKVGAECGLE